MDWQQHYDATPDRTALLEALYQFARQRPRVSLGDYRGDVRTYRTELRSITAALGDVRRLIAAVEQSSISADALRNAFGTGRLRLMADGSLDYITGQYFPVEYRPAVARVLATALWNHHRDSMPGETVNKRARLQEQFRRQFGRRIASMYFH